MEPATTVLITTYEDDLRMEITLRGFMRQDPPKPFELIVVNDGGKTDTASMLQDTWDEFASRNPWKDGAGLVGLHYYYLDPPSPDFRLAAARNLGLKHVRTDQVIICDCDTVPGGPMVEEHMKMYNPYTVLIGRRKHVRRDSVEAVTDPSRCDPDWLVTNTCQDDDRVSGSNMDLVRKYIGVADYSRPWEVTWGCNFSFPTERARSIGGFDEEFVGWGGEDEDLARRMFRMGARFKAIPQSYVYHLDHARRTQQVASQIFYRKFDGDVVRNGGRMQYVENHTYIGRAP